MARVHPAVAVRDNSLWNGGPRGYAALLNGAHQTQNEMGYSWDSRNRFLLNSAASFMLGYCSLQLINRHERDHPRAYPHPSSFGSHGHHSLCTFLHIDL